MTTSNAATVEVANEEAPTAANNAEDVLAGLRLPVKHISPKYFYDQTGSELFDQITKLPEYYLTRAELSIMDRIGDELGRSGRTKGFRHRVRRRFQLENTYAVGRTAYPRCLCPR